MSPATSPEANSHLDDDARALAELGYAQELHRGMSAFSNFTVSFSIILILAGCITSYRIALVSGGPSAVVLGWAIVGVLVLALALAMAEVCSRYPTAGAWTSGRDGWPRRTSGSGPGASAGSTSWGRSRSPRRSTSAAPPPGWPSPT